ncbi:MAG: metal ABC transporter substrate-binding protein [Clostridia bacterium]|nr:metal ABC transporter substrate-binding protein [Clostridia bacterium]MDD4387081.1 metal ABC transporter substrate-binding protein [Clostridia bacterium]
MKKYGYIIIAVIILAVFISIGIMRKNEKLVDNGKLKIITSFYPMYIATLNIVYGINDVELTNLTKPTTGCLHDYQLSPEEMIKIESGDIFVVNGAGMESFMDNIVNTYPNLKLIYASKNIELIKDESGIDNAHVWVSISKHIEQIKNISDSLSIMDPKNGEKYTSNANKYILKLEEQLEKMKTALSSTTKKDIITFHEAFPYFAKEFGLNIISVIEREPGTEPSPKELADTIEVVKDSNVQVLFAEPQYSKSSADTISEETGAKVFMLDPIVTGDLTKNSYIDIMNKNLEVLQEALK